MAEDALEIYGDELRVFLAMPLLTGQRIIEVARNHAQGRMLSVVKSKPQAPVLNLSIISKRPLHIKLAADGWESNEREIFKSTVNSFSVSHKQA